MTTTYHDPIVNGAAANAAVVNEPLGQLDAELVTVNATLVSLAADIAGLAGTNRPIAIDGLRLLWNSDTSISVDVGACFCENDDQVVVTSPLALSGLSLTPDTWYHVYVYLSSGDPAAEVVTTAPVAWKSTAYSKTGDTSRRYVGSILADSSGNVMNFVHHLPTTEIFYRKFASNQAPHRVLNAGVQATATAIDLSGIIPLTASVAGIRVTSTGDKYLYISEDNGVGVTQQTLILTNGNVAVQNAFAQHLVDENLQIWYTFASTLGSGAGWLDVLSYKFKR